MRVVYVAGPYRAKNAWLVEANVRRAECAAMAVAEAGVMPLCPHTNTRFFNGTLTDEFWLAGTLALLRKCDALIMVEGWLESSGALAEKEEAERLGIPVFYAGEYDKLEKWARQ